MFITRRQFESRLRTAPNRSGCVRWGGGGGRRAEGRGEGERVLSQIFPKTLAGYISVIKFVIAFKFSQCVGHT